MVIQVLTQLTGECNMWRLVRSLYEDRQCRIDSPDVPDPDNLLASDQTIISQLFDSSREIREVLAKNLVELYFFLLCIAWYKVTLSSPLRLFWYFCLFILSLTKKLWIQIHGIKFWHQFEDVIKFYDATCSNLTLKFFWCPEFFVNILSSYFLS